MLRRLFEKRDLNEQNASGLLARGMLSNISATGVNVTPESALRASAVFACIRVLSESEAMLPLVLYRQRGKTREKAEKHPIYTLLHDAPNPEMTAFNFRQTLMSHLCLRGNAYAYIETNRAGKIVALWPLNPDGVQIVRDSNTGELLYGIELPKKFGGEYRFLLADQVWHLRGLGSDGLVGYSPIRLAREAIGLSLATEGYGAAFFGNNAEPGFVLIHPGKLGNDAYNRLKTSWENRHKGFENAHRVAILEEGMKPEKLGISPEDAQFLDTRKFQVNEIARIFRVPPHMIADLDRATFSNIEHLGLEFVMYSLMPWLVNIEQSIKQNLLSESEKSEYYAKHTIAGLLRGDIESRYRAYATARQWGFMSVDEIRELEEMNPLPGGAGEVFLTPMNMLPSGAALPAERAERPAVEVRSIETREIVFQRRRRVMQTYQEILRDAFERIYRRERNDIINAARRLFKLRTFQDFNNFLDDFYNEHRDFIIRNLTRVYDTYAQLVGADAAEEAGKIDAYDSDVVRRFVGRYLEAFADREVYDGRQRIDRIVRRAQADGEDVIEALEAGTEDWTVSRAQASAHDEAVRLNGAVSVTVWQVVGVTMLVWRTYGETTCPYCQSLDGKRVAIDGWFLKAGEQITGEGIEPYLSRQDHRHPPLHDGCDCMLGVG
ncbi:MAG: hypothetical protein KatS3mg054_0651 [Chloroflexus sp.]|nr:MAG: hypothetical protein KatS3mg054_0651 [Chloroflexus sp.]